MKQTLETEIRELWQRAYYPVSEEEQDIFFGEIFDAAHTIVVYDTNDPDRIIACGQWGERKMTFVAQPVSVAVIDGVVVDASLKAAQRSEAVAQVFAQLHRQMFEAGIMYSIFVPVDKNQRTWMEKQGYMTTCHQVAAEAHLPEGFALDPRLVVTEAEEWGRDLWIYYAQHAGGHNFELKLSEGDFYAMIAHHDLNDGRVLVCRRHGKICGIALVRREGKPLKSGKPSEKQFRANIRYILASDGASLYHLYHAAESLYADCKQVVITGGCPAKGFKGAVPTAMMRAICVERFLKFVAERLPGLQLAVSIESDTDLPANNGSYRLRGGRCYVGTEFSESVVTPGGVPAMLLAGQPVQIPRV